MTTRHCMRCGCRLSAYTPPSDRYCHPCHPKVEAAAIATCRRGHDRTVYGVLRGGQWDCRRCAADRERERRAERNKQ